MERSWIDLDMSTDDGVAQFAWDCMVFCERFEMVLQNPSVSLFACRRNNYPPELKDALLKSWNEQL